MTEEKNKEEAKPKFRSVEEIKADIERKGATSFLQIEVLLDIRELLVGFKDKK